MRFAYPSVSQEERHMTEGIAVRLRFEPITGEPGGSQGSFLDLEHLLLQDVRELPPAWTFSSTRRASA